MSVIERVRADREDLARVLTKSAGIRRIVEDLYPDTAHFIYELLQNAEDTGASEASFALSPGSLAFEHDGRTFDEADIRAITSIGEGTKADDEERIGRFGIGFKAVFPYTETPRIWSPSYCFRIAQMVLPSELPPDPILGSRTRFEFPFDSAKKPRAQAFQEVRDGLEEISDNTLLFLSSIEEIQWRIVDGREGRLLRIQHSEHHIEILREIDGRPTESSHFLRFTERVEGLDRQYSAIAFELEPLAGSGPSGERDPFASRFRIVPADRGCVAVYFTAAKETSNLRFHLHAPFVPELSRSSIKDTPANEPLFRQLAGLAAGSLIAIRDLGLLDRDFLAVLPHDRDTIPAPYAPIREAIVGAMNDLPLTPVHSGGHAPARRLLQASAGLKALLDGDDLRFLVDGDDGPLDWAIAATQRNNDVDRFLRSLAIEDWDVEQFVEVLEDRMLRRPPPYSTTKKWVHGPEVTLLQWMGQKPEAWHRALYALFHRELEKRLHRFRGLRIVRLSDGGYGTGVESFFPTAENHEDDVHPRVARDTITGGTAAEHEGARRFLEGIGVREVGELQQVEAVLRQRYAEPDRVPHWSTYESDLKRFIALAEMDKDARSLFADYLIFQRADGLWSRPDGVYLDVPWLDTGLEAYFGPLGDRADRAPLSDRYKSFDMPEPLVRFAEMCGVAVRLEIRETNCRNNPRAGYLHSAPGYTFTHTGTDRDFVIPELGGLFENPTLALSRLVWNTLRRRSDDERILRACYRHNRSNDPHFADSQLVHQLRESAWIPQGDGTFVRPAEATTDLLPEGFAINSGWPWLAAIRFGAETEERAQQRRKTLEMATELGFSDEAALADAKRFAELDPAARQRILADHEISIDLPRRAPRDRPRRAESVRDAARKAPDRRTEKRPRSVSVDRGAIKREQSVPYLRDLYTNADGVTVCQMCKDRLPFKLADGSYFLEAVEFLPGMEKRHHQNYLALCPNHAAMYMHANPSRDEMRDRFLAMDGSEMELTLADRPVSIYFTETHIADLRVIVELED
ncbi:MAG: hypothetical protein OXC14_17345 [Rhodospirillaceae bacterium]|nr:hypothetical protein [Rhodospirillaceae bacterium]